MIKSKTTKNNKINNNYYYGLKYCTTRTKNAKQKTQKTQNVKRKTQNKKVRVARYLLWEQFKAIYTNIHTFIHTQ